MIIRRALTEDAHGIAAVHVSAWRDAYRGIVPQSYLDQISVANREKRWAEIFERDRSETLVADAGDHIIGFVSYGKSRQEPALGNVGEIYAIYVASSHWSMGVGQLLWEAALARLHELSFVRTIVWVLVANERAIRFYERIGFKRSRGSETIVEIGGEGLPEIRYEVAIA
jgi:ribosomal protein S18 acetylase RimI-like enzyme